MAPSLSTTEKLVHGNGRRPSALRSAVQASWFYPVLTAIILAVGWEVAASNTESLLIPTFSATLSALVELLTDSDMWAALWASNEALIVGFTISVAVGVPLGLATGRSTFVQQVLRPYLNILLVTPMAVLIPLLIMATGLGLTSRVILIVASSIVGVIVNAQVGVRQSDRALIEMARSFGASELQIWRRILLPGSVPAIMAGIRLALSQAVQAMVLIELLMIAVGIGALMIEFRGRFLSAHVWAVVLIVVIESLVLVYAARWLERKAAPWAERARAG